MSGNSKKSGAAKPPSYKQPWTPEEQVHYVVVPFIVNGTCYPLHHHYILILISDEIGGVAQSVSTGGG